MINCMYNIIVCIHVKMICIVLLVLCTAKFDAVQECIQLHCYSRYTVYSILGHNRVSRLQEMSRFQGVRIIYMYLFSIQYT